MNTAEKPLNPGAVSHAELVEAAAKWLVRQGCVLVVTEAAGGWYMTGESPDAIGWKPDGKSILVEAKATRSDFLSDGKKKWRLGGAAMGALRYYIAPKDLIAKEELPAGWGLLEVGRNLRGDVAPAFSRATSWGPFERNLKDELLATIAASRRLGVRHADGATCDVFRVGKQVRTTIHVEIASAGYELQDEAEA